MPQRQFPAGTSGGPQPPSNVTPAGGGTTFTFWSLGDWANWTIVEYDEEDLRIGGCSLSMEFDLSQTEGWSLTADNGSSMSGSGGLTGKSGSAGITWATSQGFGYAQTGSTTVTMLGTLPAKVEFRPVLAIQYKVREYRIRYCDWGFFSGTWYTITIRFRSLVGWDWGYMPC